MGSAGARNIGEVGFPAARAKESASTERSDAESFDAPVSSAVVAIDSSSSIGAFVDGNFESMTVDAIAEETPGSISVDACALAVFFAEATSSETSDFSTVDSDSFVGSDSTIGASATVELAAAFAAASSTSADGIPSGNHSSAINGPQKSATRVRSLMSRG